MALRIVSQGNTTVKKLTTGTPVKIGEAQQPELGKLSDVNDSAKGNGKLLAFDSASGKFIYTASAVAANPVLQNLSDSGQFDRAYLRYDSATAKFDHRSFDSDAMAVGVTSFSYNGTADSSVLTIVTGSGSPTDKHSKTFKRTLLTKKQLDIINSEAGGAALTWKVSGADQEIRTAKQYIDSDATAYDIRSMAFINDSSGFPKLQIGFALFTPILSATGQALNWDESATSFTAIVDNPFDVTSRFIDSVKEITQLTGYVDNTISKYGDSAKTVTPAGGVDFNQKFNTSRDSAEILSTTNNLVGGSASASLKFTAFPDSATTFDSATFTTNWSNASSSVSMSNLSNKSFLETYTSTSYTVSKNNVKTPANHVATVTPTGGTVSNASGNGTFTFATPIHHSNSGGRTLACEVAFIREPGISSVGGYTFIDSSSDTSLSASFRYYSFWILTSSTAVPPSNADIVSGTSYSANQLGNQARVFGQTVNNPNSGPRAFWFGVRSSASQPSTFQTGSGPSLLVDASVTTGNVSLAPTAPPAGFAAEGFNLYGITVQPGNTYVSIS